MNPALAALFELKVFDGVGHVNIGAFDIGVGQRAVEKFACRADEGVTLQVFIVAGLLADEDDSRRLAAFAEDGLRGVGKEIAAAAGLDGSSESRVGAFFGKERFRSGVLHRRSLKTST